MVASRGKVTMVDDGVFYFGMGCRADGRNIMDTETKANGGTIIKRTKAA